VKIYIESEGQQTVLRTDLNEVRVGRAQDNEVRLVDARVSRHHCRLEFEDGGAWVVDLGSANGVLVSGQRTRKAFLPLGEELELGGSRLRLESERQPDLTAADDEALRTQTGTLERGDQLAAFARVCRALVTETELRPLLRLIVDSAIDLAEAERGFLVLTKGYGAPGPTLGEGGAGEPVTIAEDERFQVQVARLFDRSDIPVPDSRLSGGIASMAVEQGRGLLSVDAGADERFEAMASVEELRLRSVLCVPILSSGRAIGALYLDNRLQKGVFDEQQLALVQLFADQAALALRNARLLQELRERNRRLAETNAQIEGLNEQLGRKVRDRDEQLAVVRAELGRERGRYDYSSIVGSSDSMRRVFQKLDRIVECDLPVLIRGESGTGKELIARAIHYNGERKGKPFVSENCAALPDSLLESELFGHAKGAFTGADRAKKGLIEQASGGTLFLDEIGDMSTEMQKKLLRVLQEGEVRPLGSDRKIEVDIRLLAASHRNLKEMVAEGEFREDLFYRVCVLEVELPPLRGRAEDIPLLARELLARAAREQGRPAPHLPHEVLGVLSEYHWPGNVRELENEMRRLMILAEEAVRVEHLSPSLFERQTGPDASELLLAAGGNLRDAVANFERRAIEASLHRHQGNKSRAATELGISRFALQRKLEKYGMTPENSGS
jgi:transcriptional regulator with GAF, ATPase, and Fis domain